MTCQVLFGLSSGTFCISENSESRMFISSSSLLQTPNSHGNMIKKIPGITIRNYSK